MEKYQLLSEFQVGNANSPKLINFLFLFHREIFKMNLLFLIMETCSILWDFCN